MKKSLALVPLVVLFSGCANTLNASSVSIKDMSCQSVDGVVQLKVHVVNDGPSKTGTFTIDGAQTEQTIEKGSNAYSSYLTGDHSGGVCRFSVEGGPSMEIPVG